jgi:hypothetical protein
VVQFAGVNLTGVTMSNVEVIAKRLKLLHELVPAAKSIAFLVNPINSAATAAEASELQAAARVLGLDFAAPGSKHHRRDRGGFATLAVAISRLPALAAAHAGVCGSELAPKRVFILDAARIPHDLETGQELDITRRTATVLQGDTIGFVGGQVFRPVLPQRILRRGLIGETGFLVAPENDGAAPGSLAARPDLKIGRDVGAPTAGLKPSIDVVFLALLR